MKVTERNPNMTVKVATLALIVQNDKLLLGKRSRKGVEIGELTLNGPGGKIEGNQTPFECLAEEVLEEVGLTLLEQYAEEVAVIVFHNGDTSIYRVHVFLVSSFLGTLAESEEMKMPEDGWWYPVSDLPYERMLASDREWMPRALMGLRFKANVYQSDDGKTLTQPIEYSSY